MNKRIRIFLTVIALLVITDSYAEVADGLDKIMNPSEPAVQEPCADCPEMVNIPSLGISIGKYEVTQGQWKAVMGTNPSYFAACGDNCPVESVSWNDIQAFLTKLNQRTGQQYRLASEQEWEAACRAGGQHEYCGSNTVDEVAWYRDNSGNSTHPVGKKKPNAFGLYDMSGNVWEWVQDCDNGDCTFRVLRGGSWTNYAGDARSADRIDRAPDIRYVFGFRFALGQTAKNVKSQKEAQEANREEKAAVQESNTATAPQAKDKNCTDCPEMVNIPSLGISIGKYEVTQGQWKAIMGTNPSYFAACGDNCPVESVSWNDIQAFLTKLNQRTGQQYRLPSEKEWEAACRAGGQHEYCGSNTVDEVAWYFDNSGKSPHPVGKKKPNAFGLYDMSGNVWEWVQDCYEGDCASRVLRGGSWDVNARLTSSANRNGYTPDYGNFSIGFRFALGQTAK